MAAKDIIDLDIMVVIEWQNDGYSFMRDPRTFREKFSWENFKLCHPHTARRWLVEQLDSME